METLFQLLRVKSWVKNGFVLLPLIFSLRLMDSYCLLMALHGVLVFSLISSSIYIFNDIIDAKADALHPRKKLRPIASGKVKVLHAGLVALLSIVFAILVFIFSKMPIEFMGVLVAYFILNIAYSLFLKKVPIVELIIVSTNFVLRVLSGCFVIAVAPSHWILVVTFFLSLLLVVVKRKSEILMLNQNATIHRQVLNSYSVEFLNMLVYISATITITAYLLYTIDPQVFLSFKTDNLMYSTLFVFLGIVRFIQISGSKEYDGEGDPTIILFKDRFIQISIICWLVYLYLLLYVFK